jgi:hypothetical protein
MRDLSLAILPILFFLFFTQTTYSQVTIDAPNEVNAGAEFKVKWAGQENKSDFITIVEADAEEKKYGKYVYTKFGEILTLRAPDTPGAYEIRYMDGRSYETMVSLPINVIETTATLESPAEVAAGSDFKIYWQGPNNKQDFITIIEADAEERKYGPYSYTKKSKEDRDNRIYVTLRAPDNAGSYEIRYLTGQKYLTLARVPVTVTSTLATLEAPADAAAGSDLKVIWQGPGNKQDYITIVEAEAEEGTYSNYTYTRKSKEDRDGNVFLTVRVPDKAGLYEIRYLTGQSKKTLARIPLTINSTEATIEVPTEVSAGSKFKVYWQGPDNKQDFITIIEADAEDGKYGSYRYTSKGEEDREGKIYLTLNAPDEDGNYEVRYVTGQTKNTLAFTPIYVIPVTATLNAPEQVVVKEKFNVSWTGPDNNSDAIAIYDSDKPEAELKTLSYTRRGNPLKIEAPKTPGLYEIRYITAQSKKVLTAQNIEVLKSNEPGTLKVLYGPGGTGTPSTAQLGAVELILDASGSMLKKLDGTPRINIAKDAVINLVNNGLEPGTPFALRVFGHMESDSCKTDLEIPLNPLDKSNVVSKVNSIQAKNLAKTPIGKSLSMISDDLAGVEGKTIIVLVTDGEETCDGDPKKEIQNLKDQGYDVRVNIVGFAINELMLKETFREWAQVGNGSYFDATNAEELVESILQAIEVPYEVLNQEGDVVATGVLNGDPVSVPTGTYNVNVLLSPAQKIEGVVIEPEQEKVYTLE